MPGPGGSRPNCSAKLVPTNGDELEGITIEKLVVAHGQEIWDAEFEENLRLDRNPRVLTGAKGPTTWPVGGEVVIAVKFRDAEGTEYWIRSSASKIYSPS